MGCKCNGEHDHEHKEACNCDEDCNCGNHDHHHDEEDVEIINLTLEDGSKLKCEVVVIFPLEDKEYVVLLPENSENVFIYGYLETDAGPELFSIEDDDEFDKAAQAYNDMEEVESDEE